jgi:hypothetical protein
LSRYASIVDRAADEVPQRGLALPFVKQAWDGSFEHAAGLGSQVQVDRGVHVDPDHAPGGPECCRGLAAPFGTLDQYSARPS